MNTSGRTFLALIILVAGGVIVGRPGFTQQASGQRESVSILKPQVYPDTPENRALIDKVIQWSVTRANDLYGLYIDVDYNQRGRQAEYSVLVSARFSGGDSSVSAQITRNRDGSEGEMVPALGEITTQNAIHLANTIFYQWSAFHGYLADQMSGAPLYVDEIPLDLTSQSLFGMTGMLAPWSAAVKTNSHILVGTSTVCLEMDRWFRVIDQPGRELYDNGEYGYANVVAVTPAGTPFFKNLSSGKVIKWFGNGLQPQSWKIGSEYMGSFAALPDGSALAAHAGQQQTLQLKGRRPEKLEFLTQPNLYYSALSSGPDGNIWVYSVAERRIRIYTPEGQLVDSVIPLDPDKPVPTQMTVYPDGSFLFFAQGWLYRFHRNGVPLWRTNRLLGPDEFASLNHAWVAPDPNTGLIYLSDVQGRRIIKLLDSAYSEALGIRNETEELLIRSNQRLFRNPDDVAALRTKAEAYERIGTMEMARSMWEKILEIDPSSEEAQEKLEEIELARLLVRAAELEEQTRSVLDSLGPESARLPYTQTMQLYEQILKADPENREIQRKRRELKILFDESQRRITITAARIEDLFPSLMQRYRTHPVGTVAVHNILDEEVRELKASLFIEGYMDFPTESTPIASLPAKGKATLDLRVLFNTSVFNLQEDLPVQAKIEVSYQSSRGMQKSSKVEALMLYRKTALVWDDSAKLASFIMPNEEIVSTFAHRVSDIGELEKQYRLSSRLFRGMRVCDALGSYGIAYIEDPDSPISRVLGKAAVVDTVRFPRTTLLIRSGDCDDTSALLASLLESVGIATAIMTSPGHVFLAFDTGEPKENLWLFTHRNLEALAHQGTVWLPVETTILKEGFLPAWGSASELIRRHRGKIEFLPVREQRDRYPPLPLPATDLSVFEPPEQEVGTFFSRSISAVEETLYGESLKLLEERLSGQRGITAVRVRNQIGVLHARFGKDPEAEAALSRCLADDPDFTAAYLNLANLKLLRGELEAAAEIARAGLQRNPDSALLNVFLAVYHSRKGEAARASGYLDKVRQSSPELAQRYGYLA
ncbi:MAG: hypothetical protein JSV89_17685, partial [Spirochaetaceae bacterium]